MINIGAFKTGARSEKEAVRAGTAALIADMKPFKTSVSKAVGVPYISGRAVRYYAGVETETQTIGDLRKDTQGYSDFQKRDKEQTLRYVIRSYLTPVAWLYIDEKGQEQWYITSHEYTVSTRGHLTFIRLVIDKFSK